jgi:hypothetical protein
VSLYLLVSRAKLKGFDFSDSRTLMAFNEISQGVLDWNEGQLPDQLTQHTELADDRTAGFLHLRLRRNADGEALDFLLPDLPGEWSTSFVDKDRKSGALMMLGPSPTASSVQVGQQQFDTVVKELNAIGADQSLRDQLSAYVDYGRSVYSAYSSDMGSAKNGVKKTGAKQQGMTQKLKVTTNSAMSK